MQAHSQSTPSRTDLRIKLTCLSCPQPIQQAAELHPSVEPQPSLPGRRPRPRRWQSSWRSRPLLRSPPRARRPSPRAPPLRHGARPHLLPQLRAHSAPARSLPRSRSLISPTAAATTALSIPSTGIPPPPVCSPTTAATLVCGSPSTPAPALTPSPPALTSSPSSSALLPARPPSPSPPPPRFRHSTSAPSPSNASLVNLVRNAVASHP